MAKRYYEDFPEDWTETFGPRPITRAEIVAFASEYDPQPMHLDEEAAKHTVLGVLCASGWHVCCFMFRMMYDGFIADSASLGSPGVEEMRWRKPVQPGMSLTLRCTLLDKRISKSRPEMGLARMRCELFDENGAQLATQLSTLLLARRNPESAR
jgi:acyl dehydratase